MFDKYLHRKTQNLDSHVQLGNPLMIIPQNNLNPDLNLHTVKPHLPQFHQPHYFGVEEELSDLHSLFFPYEFHCFFIL